jgi:hypothetical protein
MPSFEQLLLSAPHGFASSCLALNKLDVTNESFASAVQESYFHVVNRTELNPTNLHREKKTISFIIRSMKSAHPVPSLSNAANTLLSKSLLSQSVMEQILLKVKELSSLSEDSPVDKILKVTVHLLSFIVVCYFHCQ